MFELITYIFAIFGVIGTASAIIKLFLRSSVPAVILYPMYHESGDVYTSLKTLSDINLPLIAVKDDNEDTSTLEKEFLYADFIKRSEIINFIEKRL